MYAVFISGGKQYRAEAGESLKVAKLPAEIGDVIDIDNVLMVADGEKIQVGSPTLKKGIVKAKVVSHGRHKKIRIIKFKRRKHHEKQMGHRQDYTEIEITGIHTS